MPAQSTLADHYTPDKQYARKHRWQDKRGIGINPHIRPPQRAAIGEIIEEIEQFVGHLEGYDQKEAEPDTARDKQTHEKQDERHQDVKAVRSKTGHIEQYLFCLAIHAIRPRTRWKASYHRSSPFGQNLLSQEETPGFHRLNQHLAGSIHPVSLRR
jgi:hypothetical protein